MKEDEQDAFADGIDYRRLFLWNMPFLTEQRAGFHMPGHGGSSHFPEEYAQRLLTLDTTEFSASDDLHAPVSDGAVSKAMERAAEIYGSYRSFFVTTGATTAIQVMFSTIKSSNSFILLPRFVHMSVLHILALLHLPFAFLPDAGAEVSHRSLLPLLTAEMVKEGLKQYPQTTDVFLTSPDYYGQVAQLEDILQVVRDRGVRLLVDEAHGSHFAFAEDTRSWSAIHAGADLVVHSLHKTLPALTQSALLHITKAGSCRGGIEPERLWGMLRIFETSSPSFVIAGSIEYALNYMYSQGSKEIQKQRQRVEHFLSLLPPDLSTHFILEQDNRCFDPMRLIFYTGETAFSALTLAVLLEQKGIFIEFADLRRLVFLLSPWQSLDTYQTLALALTEVWDELSAKMLAENSSGELSYLDRELGQILGRKGAGAPELNWLLAEEDKKTWLPLHSAVDRVCAAALIPYPPGIPLLWPGELISKELVAFLSRLQAQGISILGLQNGALRVVK